MVEMDVVLTWLRRRIKINRKGGRKEGGKDGKKKEGWRRKGARTI